MDDSVIKCDEIIEETKTVLTNLNKKRSTCKAQTSIFHFHFYYLLLHYS